MISLWKTVNLLHQQLLLVVKQLLTGYDTVSLIVMVVGRRQNVLSVAYSAFGDSTMASTGQDSWQKPQ
jgi:hypothetical protein